MKWLADLGPAKLHQSEQDLIRDAADTLLFAEDESAEKALVQVEDLTATLVESDRLLEETAQQLLRDLEDAGPATAVA
jgi:hypothetical protein